MSSSAQGKDRKRELEHLEIQNRQGNFFEAAQGETGLVRALPGPKLEAFFTTVLPSRSLDGSLEKLRDIETAAAEAL